MHQSKTNCHVNYDRHEADCDPDDGHSLFSSPCLAGCPYAPRFMAHLKTTPSTGDTASRKDFQDSFKYRGSKEVSRNSARCHLLKVKLGSPPAIPGSNYRRKIYRTNLPILCGLEKPDMVNSSKSERNKLPKWMVYSDLDLGCHLPDGQYCPRNSVTAMREQLLGKNIFNSQKLKTFMEFSELRLQQEKLGKNRVSFNPVTSEISFRRIEINYNSFKKVALSSRPNPKKLKPALKREEGLSFEKSGNSEKRFPGNITPKVSFSPSCMIMHYLLDSRSDESQQS